MGRTLGSKNKRTGRDKFPTCYIVDEATGCWNWIRPLGNRGYGEFRNNGHTLAHRWAYATFVRPIPEGLHVLHRCDNKACVNPDHLFAGTNTDNIHDMINKGRHYSKGKTLVELFGEEEAARRLELLRRGRENTLHTPERCERQSEQSTQWWASLTKEGYAAQIDKLKAAWVLRKARR